MFYKHTARNGKKWVRAFQGSDSRKDFISQ